jgi:YD repeat-containing protein
MQPLKRLLPLCSLVLTSAFLGIAPGAALAAPPARIGGRVADVGDTSLILVGRNLDGSVEIGQKKASSLYGGPQAWTWGGLSGVLSSQPVTVVNSNNKLIVFGRGTDNRMYFRQQTTIGDLSSFAGWDVIDSGTNPSSGFRSDPALVRLGDGRLEVFGTANDGSMYTSTQITQAGSWAGWSSLGKPGTTTLVSSPVVAINANGALSLFARGNNNELWTNQQTSAGGAWRGWTSLGWALQNINTSRDCIAVDYDSNGRLVAIVNNAGGTVSFRVQSSPSGINWNAWGNLIGGAHGNTRPAVARNADGRLTVFFWADYGTSLAYESQTAPGASTWNNWTDAYPKVTSSPVMFVDANGIIHAFALDASGYPREMIQSSANASTYNTGLGPLPYQFSDL